MQTNINEKPNITVLMPVYNGEKYLKEAIESILNQTFVDFEFLIINDGSTDNSEKITKSYKDTRIKLINNEINLGLIKTLNKGLDLANGKYIARMDQDDISLPNRLKIQVNFMDKHPEIGVSGAWAKTIGGNNKKYIKNYSDFEKIKTTSLFKSILIHPSVIIKKSLFNKYNLKYDENHQHAEDYELWTRAITYFPIANIKKYLIYYRIHEGNTSHQYTKTQTTNANIIKIKQLQNNLEITPTEEEKIIHCSTYKPEQYTTLDFLDKEKEWLDKLIIQNQKINYCKEPQFSMVIANRWLTICSVNANYDFKIFKIFWKSNLRK
ncbi:MAG: glycosyltransferase, partial [Candidatus Jacksonbacteria bacterium]